MVDRPRYELRIRAEGTELIRGSAYAVCWSRGTVTYQPGQLPRPLREILGNVGILYPINLYAKRHIGNRFVRTAQLCT